MDTTTSNGLSSLLTRKSSTEKKRTTLYIGKDCKPELAVAICKLLGLQYTVENVLDASGTEIFTAVLLKLEELLQK